MVDPDFLPRPGPTKPLLWTSYPRYATQVDSGTVRWWTFAGGRINHTLKYALEWKEGWKVVANNLLLRITGHGVTLKAVHEALGRMSDSAFWSAPDLHATLPAMVPAFRLSKFQFALSPGAGAEMLTAYQLDLNGTARLLGVSPAGSRDSTSP